MRRNQCPADDTDPVRAPSVSQTLPALIRAAIASSRGCVRSRLGSSVPTATSTPSRLASSGRCWPRSTMSSHGIASSAPTGPSPRVDGSARCWLQRAYPCAATGWIYAWLGCRRPLNASNSSFPGCARKDSVAARGGAPKLRPSSALISTPSRPSMGLRGPGWARGRPRLCSRGRCR